MEHGKLIRDVIQAARDFHARQLWKRFTNFDCFAVRVPGKEDPLLACVMGDAGEQYGLMLLQGPRAAESLAALIDSDGPGDDATEDMDMLSFSMDAFGEMATETQAFLRQAGVHPKYDERVPSLLVKPANCRVRLPDDAELVLLLAVLKAVVAADGRRLLQPAGLEDRDGICFVTLGGAMADPTISVTRDRLPRQSVLSQSHVFAAASLDFSGMELLDATWLVGTPVVPVEIADDNRSMQLLLVADDASGMILQSRPFFSEQPQEAVDALVETFRGRLPKGRKGLPGSIVFSNRKLHDALALPLRKAGVKCIYMPVIPRLHEIAAEFLGLMGGDMPSLHEYLEEEEPEKDKMPAPDDLSGWKEADRRLCLRFADFLRYEDRLWSSRAATRYLGHDDVESFLEENAERGAAMAYSAWGILDYRPGKNSKTHAEKMLAQGLPQAQAMLLRARIGVNPTLYRVAGHDPKAGTVDLEDVLLGGAVTVWDQLLSENIDNNMFIPARAFPAGRFHFIEIAGPPLGFGMGMEAVEFLRDCELEFTREGLNRGAHKFGWLWGWADEWQANRQPPRLCNTDGDDIIFHTASFSVANPAEVRKTLLLRKDIDYDEQSAEFVWSKATGEGAKMLGETVTLGRIQFVGDELVLTANSAKRFEAARAWLTALPGVTFLNLTTKRVDEPDENRPLDDRLAASQPVEITPEMATALQEMFDKRYMEWLDTPLPILSGKTPRQACRTPSGREQITTLIRTMPDPVGDAPISVPRQAMLRELGLDTKPLASPFLPVSGLPSPSRPTLPPSGGKVGRNDPCPCGSGKKYKKCCGR